MFKSNFQEVKMRLVNLILIPFLFFILIFSCSDSTDNDDEDFVSSDRDKFVGSWAGTYECTNSPGDTLIIALGTGDFGFIINLHEHTHGMSTVVTGELTGVNEITIPEQEVNMFTTSGIITYSEGTLTLSQSGLGITCHGTYPVKF
jgi:hypothetical protein